MAGCTSPLMMSRMIVDEPTRMVRLEVMYREGRTEHSHPVTMSSNEFEGMLRAITASQGSLVSQLSRESHDDKHSAFHDEQIHFFAQAFATAFTKASPLEEVMFYWNESRNSDLQEITSGRTYIQGKEWHLHISNYRHAISGQRHADQAKKQPQHMLGAHIIQLRPDHNGHIQSDSAWSQFTESSPQHIVLPIQRLGIATPILDPPNATIVEKLDTLRVLRERDLISEKEYQQKRRRILEVF